MFQACLLIFSASAIAAAAPSGDWDDVTRIAPGAAVELRRADQSKLRGRFESADSTHVTLRLRGGVEKVARSGVAGARVRAGHARGRHILIGAAIVAGSTLAMGLLLITDLGGLGSEDAPLVTAGFGAAGALLGAGAGAAWPVKWREVYRAN